MGKNTVFDCFWVDFLLFFRLWQYYNITVGVRFPL